MSDEENTWMGEDEPGIQITEYDITASSNDFNVVTIVNFLDEGAIRLPPYQRNFTWDRKRASKLIESLIIGLPVPQIFLYEEARNKFSILDGQQRLMSIYFFSKKRFPRKSKRAQLREIFAEAGNYPPHVLSDDSYFETFSLDLPAEDDDNKNLLNGLNFDTLGEYTSQLRLRPIRSVIIKQNEPKDDNSSVYEMFDRLNTGGVNLRPQEIRANLYFGDFYEAVYELNKNSIWRKIIGYEDPDASLRDVELILRSLAMLCYLDQYKPSMTRFLNRFSNYAKRDMSENSVTLLKNIFVNFLNLVKPLDANLFRLSGRFSIAIFEAALYGCCRAAWEKKADSPLKPLTGAQLGKLSSELQSALQEGTTKAENVKKRMSIAVSLLS